MVGLPAWYSVDCCEKERHEFKAYNKAVALQQVLCMRGSEKNIASYQQTRVTIRARENVHQLVHAIPRHARELLTLLRKLYFFNKNVYISVFCPQTYM